VAKAYAAPVSPFVYVLDHQRRVLARGVATDWRGLESLIEQEGTPQAGRAWVQVDDGPRPGWELPTVAAGEEHE